MKGIFFLLGEIDTTNDTFNTIENSELLKHELQNFINNDPESCHWDYNHGLDRKILYSNNTSAIRSEVRNKILQYYGDRVTDVYNINVVINNNKTMVNCKMDSIYGTFQFRSEGG